MPEFKKDESEIGSLWQREGSKGPYMTGEILGQKVVLFPVKSDNPKAPSWRVLKSKPREDKPAGRDIGGGFTQIDETDIGF